jgi:hypothetical protein
LPTSPGRWIGLAYYSKEQATVRLLYMVGRYVPAGKQMLFEQTGMAREPVALWPQLARAGRLTGSRRHRSYNNRSYNNRSYNNRSYNNRRKWCCGSGAGRGSCSAKSKSPTADCRAGRYGLTV